MVRTVRILSWAPRFEQSNDSNPNPSNVSNHSNDWKRLACVERLARFARVERLERLERFETSRTSRGILLPLLLKIERHGHPRLDRGAIQESRREFPAEERVGCRLRQ